MVPAESTRSVVPPTDRTLGDADGYEVGAPLSPDEATKVTPAWPAGVRNVPSELASEENSPPPQLMETATTPGCAAAKRTAVNRLPSELSAASTRRMLAIGAMACAHSTSRAISLAQPPSAVGMTVPPVWLTL